MGHSITTKKAMAYSLKELMKEMPFNKITIDKIVTNCGYNRQTFYYHFKDIKDLFKWLYIFETQQVVGDIRKLSTTQALEGIMRYLKLDRDVTMRAFKSLGREYVEKFLYQSLYDSVYENVVQKAYYVNVEKGDVEFIAKMYTLMYVGFLVSWLEKGMDECIDTNINRLNRMLTGCLENAVIRMKKEN